jgi:hypothetical protein
VAGAILATLGGLVATQGEAYFRRRDRERSAALLFGEVLCALEAILGVAEQARGRGEPYGPLTLRLIRAAHRETQTYERNRVTLYDLGEAQLRIRIHVLMVRVGIGLEGASDASVRIEALEDAMLDFDPGGSRAVAAEETLKGLKQERTSSFDYALATAGEIKTLALALQPLARVDFAALRRLSEEEPVR